MGVHLLYKTLPSSYTEVPNSQHFAPISATKIVFCFLSFSLFFSLSLSCMRCGPRRGGALLPKTQAAPVPRRGRQTLAITQFSKASSALCFGIELPDADVLPSNPSRWRDSSVESRVGWALCRTPISSTAFTKIQLYHYTEGAPDL